MESTFAVNDADLVRMVLIEGFTFDRLSLTKGDVVKKLAELGLLQIVTQKYKRCANPNDDDYDYADPNCLTTFVIGSGVNDSVVYCDFCNREVDLNNKQVFEKYSVRLHIPGIFKYIGKKFQNAGFKVDDISNGWTNFDAHGKSCILCIPSHCCEAKYVSYHYGYSNAILYVYLPYLRPSNEEMPSLKYITLEDLICRDVSWLQACVDQALSIDIYLPMFEAVEKAFDKFVANANNDQFERFATFIVNQAANSRSIREYERLIKRDKDNVHGQYAVSVGGAGFSDGYIFKKYYYLDGLFSGKWQHIEAKRFTSSSSILDDTRFSRFHANCREQPGVLFLANNQVTGSVWSEVKSYYDRFGWAKYAVINKDLLLEIIAVLGGESVLQTFSQNS